MDEARLAEIEREHMDLWHRNDVERDDSCDIHELIAEVRRLRALQDTSIATISSLADALDEQMDMAEAGW